jgi:DNA-directed RNA polymerase II subunit RPB3
MNPTIDFLETEDDSHLRFCLSNANVSIANGLRRTILADIPIVVFRTAPYEKNNATIQINTGRMNNEILKQRLSCIPIHISDVATPIENYQLEIDKKNETDIIQHVTTHDFKIKDITTGEYLSELKTKEIFPPDFITGDYIEFARLRPHISEEVQGEHIKMQCKFAIGTASEDSAFNVTSTCAYALTPDVEKQKQKWSEKEQELRNKTTGVPLTDEEIEFEKKNWFLLDAKRIVLPDSFDFILKSVGQITNKSIIYRACDIIIQKLLKFQNKLKMEQETMIEPTSTTINNCFDIIIHNEGYTLGKILEYVLFSSYYEKTDVLTYCGFQKPHPHIDMCKLRIGFKEAIVDKGIVASYLTNAAEAAIKMYERIAMSFKD